MLSKRTRLLLPIIALLISAAIAGGLMINKKAPEKKPSKRPTPYVSVQSVELSRLTQKIFSQGVVTPLYDTTLTAQVSGEVVSLSPAFVVGGFVNQGETLISIDPFNYEVALQQAKANLASARAAFILERAQGQVAEAEWEKISSASPSALGLRKPQQEQALAAVKAAEAAVKRAQKDLDRTQVAAPYNALIRSRKVSVGTFVTVGSPLGDIADTSIAEIRLPVSQNDFAFASNPAESASVQLGSDQQRWHATIARTEGVIDNNTRMQYLVAKVVEPYRLDPPLRFGTFVSAEITGRVLENALEVERHWLQEGTLPLLQDHKLHFQPVTVARHVGTKSVVVDGLKPGDLLITSPLQQPTEGMTLYQQGEKPPREGKEEKKDAPND